MCTSLPTKVVSIDGVTEQRGNIFLVQNLVRRERFDDERASIQLASQLTGNLLQRSRFHMDTVRVTACIIAAGLS
jgi:hypothetical protein